MPESHTCFTLDLETGEAQGPFKLETIRQKISNEDLPKKTYLWGPTKNQWTLASFVFDQPQAKPSTSTKWFTLDADQNPRGPVDANTLCDQWKSGEITDSTYCWSPDSNYGEVWKKLRDLPSLQSRISKLRLGNPNVGEFQGDFPAMLSEGYLAFLNLLADLEIDGNILLEEDELAILFGTKKSAEYVIRMHLEKQGFSREEAEIIIKDKSAYVTIYECRFLFRNLEVAKKSLTRLFEIPNVSFPKVEKNEPIVIQDSERASLIPNLEKIGVAHAIFDFADAEGSRSYHKRNQYRCNFYSQVSLFLGAVFVLLATRQIYAVDDRRILSFVAGLFMICGLGMHYMGRKSAREFSERTIRANKYLEMYGVGVKPHVLLSQLSMHVDSLTDEERATLKELAEKAG